MNTRSLTRLHIGLNISTTGKHVHPDNITRARRAIERRWDAFTITETRGLWKGKQEPSWIVERYTDTSLDSLDNTRNLCAELAEILGQDSIGLAVLPVATFELVGVIA